MTNIKTASEAVLFFIVQKHSFLKNIPKNPLKFVCDK